MKSLRKYLNYGTNLIFKKGETILSNELSELKDIFILEEGDVALTSQNKSGEEMTYAYFTGPRAIGFVPFLTSELTQPDKIWASFTIKAKTDCRVIRIEEQYFKSLLTDYEFLRIITSTLVENNNLLIHHTKSLIDDTAFTRLCRFLLEQMRSVNGRLEIPSYFKYQEISHYLNLHHITVAKVMKQLKEEGVIKKSGQQIIIIDDERLKQYVEEEEDK